MMKKLSIHLLVVVCGTSLFSACYYDVESELYPSSTCFSYNPSYTNDIRPIFQRSCFSCHDVENAPQNGNISLETYANVVHFANNGMLMGSLHHADGFEPMPQDASKLSDCEILKIESWIAKGALPN